MALYTVSKEGPRGCGFRKVGGLYLVSGGLPAPCGRLPMEMKVCPCCGEGIKPARAWTWIDPDLFTKDLPPCEADHCKRCPLSGHHGRKAGLLWIGEKFYPTPESFAKESRRLGISRRIVAVPKGFKPGKTWVLLGHRKGIEKEKDEFSPAIVFAFKPERIEQVVSGEETDDELNKIIKRGIVPVKVERIGEQTELTGKEEDEG